MCKIVLNKRPIKSYNLNSYVYVLVNNMIFLLKLRVSLGKSQEIKNWF